MRNLLAQLAGDVAQNPTTAKTAPIIAAGLGWVVASELLPLIGGVLTFLAGLTVSITVVWTSVAQHRIKMKILERDLAERDARSGRKDRRDDC